MDTCSICNLNQELVDCNNCIVRCCKTCFKDHVSCCDRMKKTGNHLCAVHNILVRRYCRDCGQLVCCLCIESNHSKHVIFTLKDTKLIAEDDIKKLNDIVDKRKTELQNTFSDLNNRIVLSINNEERKWTQLTSQVKKTVLSDVEQCIYNKELPRLLQKVRDDLDSLKCDSFLIGFLSKWIDIKQALRNYENKLKDWSQMEARYQINVVVRQSFERLLLQSGNTSNNMPNIHADDIEDLTSRLDVLEMNDLPAKKKSEETMTIEGFELLNIPSEATKMLKDPQHQRDALQKENKLLVKNEETKKNDISKSFAEIEERLDRLVKENDKLKKEIERLSEENNELKNKDMTVIEKEFTGNTDSSRKEIEKLNSDIEEHKRIVKELNVNMEGLKKENEKLCSDIEVHNRTEKELNGSINSLKKENEKHYSDVEAHTRVYNNEKEYVLSVSQSIHNLVLKIKESKSNVNSFTIEPTQNEFKDKLNDKMKKILNDVVVLKNELLRCQEAMQNEKMKMTELQTQKNDLQKQSQHFYQENAELNESLQQKDTSFATIKTKYVQLKIEAEQSRKTIKELKTEKDDLQTRLSSFAGDMLTRGNPAITDLGDPNRPMKIGEKYVELYDNEWTDAMEITDVVREIFSGMEKSEIEEVIIHHLYRLLTCCYRQCIKMSEEQIRTVVITLCLDVDKDKPGSFSTCKEIQEILAIQRRSVDRIANSFFQNRVLDEKMILQEWNYVHKSDKLLLMLLETPFYEKCVNLCWSMVIQDPVMYLDEELSKGTQYDKNVYKEYTRSGNLIQYVVWPALFLHKGGPLLFKGVVQVYRDETNIVTAV